MPSPYYGMRDPFADINARLRKLGLQPITMGGAPAKPDIAAMHQRPLSTPSPMEEQQALAQQAKKSGPMYNQLTPEAEEGVMEKIGGGLLSGVEWFGKTLDSITGARAIRGVLGGNFREVLSLGPLGLVSDAIGMTDPQDIVGGRELMEKAGILEENKPGLDWGDVGGFVGEVLLDPSTYFFGAGLATKGIQAGSKSAKALNKVGVLGDVFKGAGRDPKLLKRLLAGKKDDVSKKMIDAIDAAGGAVPKAERGRLASWLNPKGKARSAMMGERQLGRRLDLDDILRVDDELTDLIKQAGAKLPEETQALKSSFRGLSGRSVRDVLEESVGGPEEMARLMKNEWALPGGKAGSLPLTTHWSMGFPTLFTGKQDSKGIRQWLLGHLPEKARDTIHRRPYFPGLDTKFGAMLDRQAGRFDVAGEILRYSTFGRGMAAAFNPDLKWSARSAEAQKGILAKVAKFDRQTAEQTTALHSIANKWRQDGLFDEKRYTAPIEEGGFGLGQDEAVDLINKHMDEIMSWEEGYTLRFTDEGMPLSSLPDYNINSAKEIGGIAKANAVNAGRYLNSIEQQISWLGRTVGAEEGASRITQLQKLKGQAEEMHKVYSREVDTLLKISEPEDIGKAISRIKGYEKKFHNVEDYAERLEKVSFGPDADAYEVWRGKFKSPKGGVHHRKTPKLSSTFREHLKKLGAVGEVDEATGLMGIEADLLRMKKMADEALSFAQQSGIDMGYLSDEWALYRPRSVTEPRKRGFMGAIEQAKANKDLKRRMEAAQTASTEKGGNLKMQNLNPITYRQKLRRDYLQDVFGGTTALNYFYKKYSVVDAPRVQGARSILTEAESGMKRNLAGDDYWQHAIQNKEHLDNLLERGVLKEAEFVEETGEFIVKEAGEGGVRSVPVEESKYVAEVFDAHGKIVYVDMQSQIVKDLTKSILAKDSEAAKMGAKLFSVDPIRSMTGYYGDVMKAANAAEILIDLASENAYFKFARGVGAAAETGSEYTVGKIFEETKLNTIIGKRNFLERFKAERPDEWAALKDLWTKDIEDLPLHVQADMQDLRNKHPKLHQFFLNGPGKLQPGDVVAHEGRPEVRGGIIEWIAETGNDGRQKITRGPDPEGPTSTPTTPIDHSPSVGASDPVRAASPKVPMDDESITAMRDVIASLRKGGNKLEDRADLENIFEESGVLTFERSRDANVDKRMASNVDTWQARRANELEEMLNKKLAKAEEPVNVSPAEVKTQVDPPIADSAFEPNDIVLTNDGRVTSWDSIDSAATEEASLNFPGTSSGWEDPDWVAKYETTVATFEPRHITAEEIKDAIHDKPFDSADPLWHARKKQEEIDEVLKARDGLSMSRNEAKSKLAILERELEEEIQKLVKQGDEAVTPAAGPTLTAGEKVMLEDSLVWKKRNPKSGNYTTKDGGFEVRKKLNADDKQDGWDLFYLMDDGKTFDWQNDYRLLKDAKAGAKEFQESLKAKGSKPFSEDWTVGGVSIDDIPAENIPAIKAAAVDSPTNKIAALEKELFTKRSRVSDGIQKRIKYLEESTEKYKIKAEMYKKYLNTSDPHAWEAKEYLNLIKENGAEIRKLQDELSEIRNPDLTSVVSPREKALLKKYRGVTGIDSDIQDRIDIPELKKEILEAKEAAKIVPDDSPLFTTAGAGKTGTPEGYEQAMQRSAADTPAPAKPQAKPPEQTVPAERPMFTSQGASRTGTGDEAYKQLQADTKARAAEVSVDVPPPKPPPPAGPVIAKPGFPRTVVKLKDVDETFDLKELIHLHEFPNHMLKKEKYGGFSEELLGNFVIEPELADDLKRYLDSFTKRDITNEFVAVVDWFTNSFKDLATSLWPAFHFRNFISGQVNNMYSGAYDPERVGLMKWVQPVKDAMLLAQGKSIKGLGKLQIFKGMSDEQISQAIVDAAIGWGLVGPGQHLSDLTQHADELTNNFLRQAGGPSPVIGKPDAKGYFRGSWDRILGAGKLGDEAVGEVLGKAVPGYTKAARFGTGYKRAGFQFGNEVEWLNRISPLIAHLKKGLSMEEAIMKVKLAQVDYKALTPFEKSWFKRIIPFYTFTRRQIPFVLENISDPSSGMSQMAKTMFRTKQAMEDPDDPTPDWISHGVNLPLHKLGLGGSQPGMARYLTGLGGAIGGAEDVMSLFSPGHGPMDAMARSSARMGARANPIAQVPIEMMTGVSLFHQRPYKDMKSPTARLLGQVSGSEFVPKFPSPQLDMLLQRIPGFGRAVSTARTMVDSTRRPIFDEEGGFSVGNLLARTVPAVTGAKVHDTDMSRIKNRLLQNRLEEILSRNPNMVKFAQIYIPEDKLGALSQEELEAYMLYKKLGSAAARASYARKKAAEYSN